MNLSAPAVPKKLKETRVAAFRLRLLGVWARFFLALLPGVLPGQDSIPSNLLIPSAVGGKTGSSPSLRIMPMGDSITAGTIPGGYRLPLYNLLQGGGYTFDFVGNKTQSGDTTPDTNHWGQGGWQISDTPATIDGRSYVSIQGENRSGIYDEMSSAISTTYFSTNTSTSRNIILLQIGINDVLHQVVDSAYGSYNSDAGNNGQGEGQEWVAEGMIARLQALLNSINSLATSRNLRIEVMLGTLCQLTKKWKGDPISDVLLGEVREYNNFIRTVIPTMSFSNLSVKIVDQYTTTSGKLADGLHPNMEGFVAMARAWYSAITITHSNVAYGPDKIRNSLDFWQAPGDGPRPLLVNIHGGGWTTGDKSGYFDYKFFLDKGISCATINYRLTPDNPLPAPVHDAARAIQFLRSKAAEWNIDPNRIALHGESAGACSAMWLLLHDDLADPDAADPVLRQSSRVCAVAAYAGQTAIDPPVISSWIPSTVPMHNMIPYAVGQQSMATVWPSDNYESKYRAIYQEFSPIHHLDANDPPLYMEYNRSMKLPAQSDGDAIHHPMFGVKLWEKANTTAAGYECHLRFINSNEVVEYRKTVTTSYASGEEFLLAKLLAPNTTYTVTYNGNGNDSGSAPANQTKIHGVTLALAYNTGNLERLGFDFAGWSTTADSSGTNYAPGALYTANANGPLYAKWTKSDRLRNRK